MPDGLNLESGLVESPEPRRKSRTTGIRPELESHWNSLRSELEKAGERPVIRSGFRTAAQQNALHRAGKPTKGNDGYINISPHQEGRALDIGNLSDRGRRIIRDYARRSGLHVPSDEPWHIAIPKQKQTDDGIDLSAGLIQDQGQTPPPQTPRNVEESRQPSPTPPSVSKASSVPGNIDLANRPRVKNADGSTSTVRSISVNIDGREVLLPTVSDSGRILTTQQAVDEYRRSGKHLGIFNSPDAATAYAQKIHQQQEGLTRPARTASLSRLAKGGARGIDEWRPASTQGIRRLFEPPQPQRRSTLGEMATALPGVHQILRLLPEEERENVVEGATSAVGGTVRQLANAAEYLNPATYLGQRYPDMGFSPVPSPRQARQMRQTSDDIQAAVAENETQRPAPTTFAGEVRRGVGRGVGTAAIELPKLIAGGRVLGAANLPVQGALSSADEGIPGIIRGVAGGLVYHYGGQVTGKVLGKVGNSLVWIAGPTAEQQIEPRLRGHEAPALGRSIGENIPIGVFAGAGGAKRRAPEPVQVKDGETVRQATPADLPKIVNRELEVVPPAVEAAERRQIQREFDRIKEKENVKAPDRPDETVGRGAEAVAETIPAAAEAVGGRPPELKRFQHLEFGEVEVTQSQEGARAGRLRVAEVADPNKIHYVKRSDAQGRGNARMIPIKEPPVENLEAGLVEPETVRVEPEKPFARARQYYAERLADPELLRYAVPLESPEGNLFAVPVGGSRKTGASEVLYTKAEGERLQQKIAGLPGFENARLRAVGDKFSLEWGGSEAGYRSETNPTEKIGRAYGYSEKAIADFIARKHGPRTETTSVEQGVPPRDVPTELETLRVEPEPEGTVRLYRADPADATEPQGKGWANDPEYVSKKYGAGQMGSESVWYIDVPKKVLDAEYGDYRSTSVIDSGTLKTLGVSVEPKLLRRVEPSTSSVSEGAQLPERGKIARGEPKVSEQPIKEVTDVTQKAEVGREPEIGGGLGAGQGAPARETAPAPIKPSTTAAKKESMAADRAELDLPELPQAERKSWQTTLDNAKQQKLDQRASLLADEVLNKPRGLTDEESAGLVLRSQEVKNEHAKVMREIGDAKDAETIQAKRAQVEALERELDKLSTATKASGSENARALAVHKLTINQDYDLVSLIQRAKAAKGRDLRPDERVRYESMAKEIETLTTKLSKAEEQLASKQLQREIDRVIRRGRRAETKKELDDEFEALKVQFAQIKTAQGAGAFFRSERGALEPEAIKVIGSMARNRVRAGTVRAEALVDEIHSFASQHLEGITKRDIRDAISGYGIEPRSKPRAEDAQKLAEIKSELKKLSVQEDIEAGKRLTPAEKTRRTNLLKQEADLSRRLEEKDFDRPERRPLVYNRETQSLINRVNKLKADYERELYRAQRGKLGVAWDVGVNIANVPKSLKSMGDVSAVLRQGGYFSITHPILSAKAGKDMLRSFSQTGYANVEREITSHRDFDLARRSGVEFTGVEKDNPNLSKREEAYLGGDIIDRAAEIPVVGKAVTPIKAVKDVSEHTFVSFLDSQRMQVFSRFADHVRSLKMSPKEETKALKAIAEFVNIGTGRGSLGKRGNQVAPALNALMFSPRLLASRVQLMNKMVNPVAIQRMPRGARSLMIKDNVKFAGTIATALGLAKAAGAGVSLDPDDADFLKIRIGDTRYDILTGLQQPMRFIYRMARAVEADVKSDETYAGETKGNLIGRFARSKASPVAGAVTDYITGQDFKGRKFKLDRTLVDLALPLYFTDFREALEDDGVVGSIVKTSPALVGVGAQTYKDAPEKPRTQAEKLARKFVRAKLPDEARSEEKIDVDQAKSDLRARARKGEDITSDLKAMGSKITERQVRSILGARNKTRLQEDFNRLGAREAALVYSVMSSEQRKETKEIMEHKATLIDLLPADEQSEVQAKFNALGIQRTARRPRRISIDRPERPSRNTN